MPSAALQQWDTSAQAALDEIVDAHRAVGGAGRGRRRATLQVNHAFVVLLSAQFQRFCRDLHSEAVDFLVASLNSPAVGPIARLRFMDDRKLDRGNPNPGNLGSDFGKLGMQFWPDVHGLAARHRVRQADLESLNTWRNAIAHQDWRQVGGPGLHLSKVRRWRTACVALAKAFDRAVGAHLAHLVGRPPW